MTDDAAPGPAGMPPHAQARPRETVVHGRRLVDEQERPGVGDRRLIPMGGGASSLAHPGRSVSGTPAARL